MNFGTSQPGLNASSAVGLKRITINFSGPLFSTSENGHHLLSCPFLRSVNYAGKEGGL